MPRTIVSTVGTSLQTNATRSGESELAGFLRMAAPVKASAETNALSRLDLQPGDRLAFVCSATPEGQGCAEALASHYEALGFASRVERVDALHYDEGAFAHAGLRNLVGKLAELVDKARRDGTTPVINATGGFKAEIAYATAVGLVMRVPIVYIHERFNDLVELPPIPIAWDHSMIANYEEFFEWVDAEPRTTIEVEGWIAGFGHESEAIRQMLIETPDGCTYLSPAGEAFYAAYRFDVPAVQGSRILLDKQVARHLDRLQPATQSRMRRLLRQMREPDLRRTNSETKETANCRFYPQGSRPERIAFWERREHNTVVVLELFESHSDYETALNTGRCMYAEPPDLGAYSG